MRDELSKKTNDEEKDDGLVKGDAVSRTESVSLSLYSGIRLGSLNGPKGSVDLWEGEEKGEKHT